MVFDSEKLLSVIPGGMSTAVITIGKTTQKGVKVRWLITIRS